MAAGAQIDSWGVGTDLGTSRDAPAVSGVYKLVADQPSDEAGWRPVIKRSPAKSTVPHPKQVFRRRRDGEMVGDVIAMAEETLDGRPLVVPAMREGSSVYDESLEAMRDRAAAELGSLPEELRIPREEAEPTPYPVGYSDRLRELAPEATTENETV